MLMTNETTDGVAGKCYCGGVRFSISPGSQPMVAGYCHCKDCRQAHAAALYQFVYVRKDQFKITSGSELLRWYTRTESRRDSVQRYFCERCGARVYNAWGATIDDEEIDLIGTFPSLFDEHEIAVSNTWAPRLHVNCGQGTIDKSYLADGLPKYDELPDDLFQHQS